VSPAVKVWVCAECGGLYWPDVVKASGQCPSCGAPAEKGTLRDRKDDE